MGRPTPYIGAPSDVNFFFGGPESFNKRRRAGGIIAYAVYITISSDMTHTTYNRRSPL